MTHIKFNRKPFTGSINNLVDDILTEFPGIINPERRTAVPVNIIESDKFYTIEVIAPGFEKSDFKINRDQHTLTISAEKQAESGSPNGIKQIRNEYSYRKFSRSFIIDEKIDPENIDATYVNGVLRLNLLKKESVKQAHEIVVK